jgi:signal transduction histidine kinase
MMNPLTKSPEKNTGLFPQFEMDSSFLKNESGCIIDELIKEDFESQYPKMVMFQKKNSNAFDDIINKMIFDLKSSLTNIILASELLETSLLSEEQEKMVAVIMRGSNRIADLITGFNNTSFKDRLQTEFLRMGTE